MKTPPDSPRLALAEEKARLLLHREQITLPPVPAKELLEQYAILHSFDHPTEKSFCLELDSIWHVFINSKISRHSVTYLYAYELGHLILGHLFYNKPDLTPEQYQAMAREAEHFADNLLMPEGWVRNACNDKIAGESAAACLSGLFRISRETMEKRLHRLGICCLSSYHDWRNIYRKAFLHEMNETQH